MEQPTLQSIYNGEVESISRKCVLAIIGDPIDQVKSPIVFNNYFWSHGINAEMVPFQVNPKDFEMVLNGLRKIQNFVGAIITIPHKRRAFEIATLKGCYSCETNSANLLIPGPVNQWACEMLDGIGLVNALKKRNIEVKGLRTLIIGAGGAGSAIAVALQNLGKVGQIGVFDVNTKRAEEVVAILKNGQIVDSNPKNYQLVVNASPVGMGTQETPIDPNKLIKDTIVCDAIMNPPTTRLLKEAIIKGCPIVKGMEMLECQIDPIIKAFNLNCSL